MRNNQFATLFSAILILLSAIPAVVFGAGIPHLDIPRLVRSSDVIVIAEISPSQPTGNSSQVVVGDRSLAAHEFQATLRIRRLIKGRCPNDLILKYLRPDSAGSYMRLQSGTRIVFLKQEGDRYTLANPYYPDFPAAVNTSPYNSDDPVDSVFHELADVLATPAAAQDREYVLQKNYAVPTSAYLISSIKRGIATAPNAETREMLQGELVQRGDLSELPAISNLLTSGAATSAGKNAFAYAIGNKITSPEAVPQLIPLLSNNDASIRIAAAEALWHIADPRTIESIVPLLNDNESQVRYYATRALSDITGENHWGPSIPEFEEHGTKYVQHWIDWAEKNGYRNKT